MGAQHCNTATCQLIQQPCNVHTALIQQSASPVLNTVTVPSQLHCAPTHVQCTSTQPPANGHILAHAMLCPTSTQQPHPTTWPYTPHSTPTPTHSKVSVSPLLVVFNLFQSWPGRFGWTPPKQGLPPPPYPPQIPHLCAQLHFSGESAGRSHFQLLQRGSPFSCWATRNLWGTGAVWGESGERSQVWGRGIMGEELGVGQEGQLREAG